MKTKIWVIMLALLLGGVVASGQSADNQSPDSLRASAGPVENGQYFTFYEAGLYAKPIDVTQVPFQLPAITKLFQYISSIPYLSLQSKEPYLAAVLPTTKRQYMIATPRLLTPAIKQRLLAEFQRVTGVDPANLDLHALTDTNQKITYLLPGFEALSPNGQMTALFHENYWLLHPNTTYNEVVKAEMAFEAALTHPDDTAIVFDFVKYIGDPGEVKQAMLDWEISAGNLKGTAGAPDFTNSQNQFVLSQLLGDDYLNCEKTQQSVGPLHSGLDLCIPYFRNHLTTLIAQYPKSMILRDIAENVDNGGLPVMAPSRAPQCHDQIYIYDNTFETLFKTDVSNAVVTWDVAQDAQGCVVSLSSDTLNTTCQSLHFFQTISGTGGSNIRQCDSAADQNKVSTPL